MRLDVQDRMVFRTISGSRSYGLERPTSDEDTLGAFMSLPVEVFGVDGKIEHYRGTEADDNFKTLSNFIQNAVNGSSFWIEPFFVRECDIVVMDTIMEPFLAERKLFLTQALVSKSKGFMDGMVRRYRSQKGIEDKSLSPEEAEEALLELKRGNLCHANRVGNMILEMFETGDLRVHRADEREYLLGIKTGTVDLEEACERAERLMDEIAEKREKVNLPQTADKEKLTEMLTSGIISYWKRKEWI
mgnify:FL=1